MARPNAFPTDPLPRSRLGDLNSAVLEYESPTAALLAMPVKLAARSMLWTVISLLAACATAAALIPIDMVVTASGRVVALQPTVVVQPLETAIVRAINVREGQVVLFRPDQHQWRRTRASGSRARPSSTTSPTRGSSRPWSRVRCPQDTVLTR